MKKEDKIDHLNGIIITDKTYCKFCTSDAEHQLRGMYLCPFCYDDCLKDESKEDNDNG